MLQKNPLFSVVVPAYNNVDGLRRCIESVLSQSDADFELLIMDDGSGPEVCELVAGFRDPKICYEWGPNSGGPAHPRNRGIKSARGQWLCFMDHDDYWFPDKLSKVRDKIEGQSELNVVCHHEYHIDESSSKVKLVRSGPIGKNLYTQMLIYGNPFSTSAVSVRRDFLNVHGLRFSESKELVTAEDFDLWLRIVALTQDVGIVDEYLGVYFAGSGMSFGSTRHRNARHEVIRTHASSPLVQGSGKSALVTMTHAGMEMDFAKEALMSGRSRDLLQHSLRAFLASPVTFVTRIYKTAQRSIQSPSTHLTPKQIGL